MEEEFRLTSEALMQLALADFKIDVSLPMAEGIYKNFMDLLVKHGYAEWKEDENNG